MTRNLAASSLMALLLVGRAAFAQFDEGLDLSGEEQQKEEPRDEGLDLSSGSGASSDSPVSEAGKPAEKKAEGTAVERDTTQDDRVKSVQRKLYLKRGRVELAPYFSINVNDPYYMKLGFSGRLAFYPADSVALSARFTYLATEATDDVRAATRNLNSRIFYSEPIWSVLGDVEWSPFYGKVAFFNSILQFDAYLLGGGGIVTTQTSLTRDEAGSITAVAPKPAFDLGVGFRFVVRDFLAINVSLTNTTYGDVPRGAVKAITQNLMLVNVGISLFLPFKSTYREDE